MTNIVADWFDPSVPLTTIPAVTTVIGPVGPVIWLGVPPSRAAKKPQNMEPYRPARGPRPEATPNAKASGNATIAAVSPAIGGI